LDKNVWHPNAFSKLHDVLVPFKTLSHYFAKRPTYLMWIPPLLGFLVLTFSFDSNFLIRFLGLSLLKCFGLLVYFTFHFHLSHWPNNLFWVITHVALILSFHFCKIVEYFYSKIIKTCSSKTFYLLLLFF